MKQFSRFVSGFVIGVVCVALAADALHSRLWARGPLPSIAVDNSPINRSTSGLTSFAPVVKRAAPSVVNIYSTRVLHYHEQNPLMNPFFQQFFGNPEGREFTRHEQVLGSGVIITPDGYILTANHVVANAEEIKIALTGDKNEYKASVVGSDPDTDVAVLKIDANHLPAITLGDSSQLEVGDIVLAIGNPFDISQPGQTPTVTMGIVSALGRSGLGFNGYENFIQTDAAINPGNSGGALVDAQGRLVGINTAIESSSEGSEGIGFAVPANLARHVADRLISGGKVSRGYLGVMPQDITPGLAQSFGLGTENGALVGGVEPGTPAEKAGIQSGDVITEFNGQTITDENDLLLAVADCAPDSKVSIKFIRDGEARTIKVTLAERPSEQAQETPLQNQTDALNGVTVSDLDSDMRSQLQIPDDVQGAIVTDVAQDSHAAESGLQKGDIIIAVDHRSVSDADQVVNVCNNAKGKYILLKLWRKQGELGGTRYISVDNTKD
ncbi:MAG TPA: DegQ family serine endoprotease [Candidatus Acidoferrales bacterium]|jgi:serine protease Do|nr:DegQ family serine endoprotease [Candidatus Acidoferrales bacterium]